MRENPETVARLVQDNWNRGAFVWRQAFTEMEATFDFFTRELTG